MPPSRSTFRTPLAFTVAALLAGGLVACSPAEQEATPTAGDPSPASTQASEPPSAVEVPLGPQAFPQLSDD